MPSLKTIVVIGAGEHISSEDNPSRCRDQIVLGPSAVPYVSGAVLGRQRGAQTVTPAARAANAGNGTIGAITVATTSGAGRYGITFTSATVFNVEDAQGEQIGQGQVGTPFSRGGLTFTITAGGTAFAANDGFDLTVAYAVGAYVPLNPAANDGSQNYAGHLYEGRPASASNQRAVASVRATVVNGNKVSYMNAVTAAQAAAVEAQAAAQGVITHY